MADSVNSASRHLNGVTGAVTAMQAAVIATEMQASKAICDNVDKGFFTLIKSQMSQKAVAAFTEMESRQISLLQLAKALDGVKRQMENDFHMITKRYAKLFGSLNKALETMVKELDRPAMQLAEIRKRIVFDKLKDDSSVMFNISAEAIPIAQTALSGKLKRKTRDAICTLSGSVEENLSYSDKVDSILVKNENNFPGATDRRFIPVIVSVADSLLNAGDRIENVYTAKTDVWQNTAPIVSEVGRSQNDFDWTPAHGDEKERVRKEFIAICEKEPTDERLAKEIMRLFDGSTWEECKDGIH